MNPACCDLLGALDEIQVVVLAAQDRFAVSSQPAIENGCVDVAKVDLVFQIAIAEIRQAGLVPDDAAFY